MDVSMLVAYFEKQDPAERAWHRVRKRRHRGVVLVTKTATGRVHLRDTFP